MYHHKSMFTSVVTETQAMANRMETLLKVFKRIAIEQKCDMHKIIINKTTSEGTNYTKRNALSFVFSKKNPKEYENTLKTVPVNWVKGSMDDTMKTTAATALNHVKPVNRKTLENFLAKEKSRKDFRVKFCAPVCVSGIIHADFRGDNLLHRVREVPPFLRLQAVNFSTFTMEDIPQHLNNLLHKIAQEQNFVNYDLDVQPFSSTVLDPRSLTLPYKLYTVTISEESRKLHMFAKVAAVSDQIRKLSNALMPNTYDIERYCYTKIADRYDKMQNDFKVPDEHKFAFSKCYGFNTIRLEETIVLQNLAIDGYLTFDRFKSIDWPYASSAVEQLAKMHATSMAHCKYYPKEFETVMNNFMDKSYGKDMFMKQHVKYNVTPLTIELVDDKRVDLVTFFGDAFYEDVKKFRKSRRAVLMHGDYRPRNLMYKHRDDGKVDIKIVNLQTAQIGSPLIDLIRFIFTGSDEEFRAKYFDKLVEHYYTELCAALKRLNLEPEEIFSREDFDCELKEKLPYGLMLAALELPVGSVFLKSKVDNFYIERLNGIVNDYVKWGILTAVTLKDVLSDLD